MTNINTVIIIFVLMVIDVFALEIGDQCTTPNNKSGNCIQVKQCDSVIQKILTKKPEFLEFAKQSQCGYKGSQPLVCCEAIPIYFDTNICGKEESQSIMIGEDPILLESQRWVVGLEYKSKSEDDKMEIRCTGTLISERYVVTSASCLDKTDSELAALRIGEWKLSTDPDCKQSFVIMECNAPIEKLEANKIIRHPLYENVSYSNNIALIELEKNVQFNDFIKPICLLASPKSPMPYNSTVVLRLSGWGVTDNGTSYDTQPIAHITPISNEVCQKKVNHTLSENQYCIASKNWNGTSHKTMGGPVIRYEKDVNYLEGVISFKESCSNEIPIIYTRLANYMDWIKEVISNS